jgi:hypothetical protein
MFACGVGYLIVGMIVQHVFFLEDLRQSKTLNVAGLDLCLHVARSANFIGHVWTSGHLNSKSVHRVAVDEQPSMSQLAGIKFAQTSPPPYPFFDDSLRA